MSKLLIVYWSSTGNTQQMAELIKKGATDAGWECEVKAVANTSIADTTKCDILALGCSAMGAEELDYDEMEPFVELLEPQIAGRRLALFGSYGWGDGEWMRTWTQRMTKAGAMLVADALIVNEAPEGDDADRCVKWGRTITGVN